jgi:hypothetical protein
MIFEGMLSPDPRHPQDHQQVPTDVSAYSALVRASCVSGL